MYHHRRSIHNAVATTTIFNPTSSVGVHERRRDITITRMSSISDSSSVTIRTINDGDESSESSLSQSIRLAYIENETDGILSLASSMDNSNFDVDDIIDATIQAADSTISGSSKIKKGGYVASVLNAFIASRLLISDNGDDDSSAAEKVVAILELWDDKLEEDMEITPDIVTYSLAYVCFSSQNNSQDYEEVAEYVLEKALKMSKKMGGSKRRKTTNSRRRRQTQGTSFQEAESTLQDLCGKDFKVLHETDDFAVINKPSGIPCFHNRLTTAGKIRRNKKGGGKGIEEGSGDISLEDALLKCNVPLSTLNHESFGLVHRLDRASSGCLVLAKNEVMHANLIAEFYCRRVQKKYASIVVRQGDIQLPKESGYINSLVHGRPAKSDYNVIETFDGSDAALVDFEIHTGRKHQIRVHASEVMKCPILLDRQYSRNSNDIDDIVEAILNDEVGGTEKNEPSPPPKKKKKNKRDQKQEQKQQNNRIFLHASSLKIPEYGIDAKAPCPSWWNPVLEYFRNS